MFLDDDVVLKSDYFEQLLSTYKTYPEALAVGGYITNEVQWQVSDNKKIHQNFIMMDGCVMNLHDLKCVKK
ncbi:glycosyl transferase 2 [Algibacter lectus]|uniref:Glycosyl transferase 2 n=1 Tax=Algibacter lectus TaxID=221126 RepID=A0A090X7A2_9FLAO|nr:glycosyl transferase 2 [Algibacter lectus]